MPKNQVTDLITDQEMAFGRLILAGTMTDRQAAESAGLNPDTAAYTKAKPRVREYMLEHRAAVQERLVQQEADLSRRAEEETRQQNIGRAKVLARLWEIANLSPEMTRNSISGQVKALSMIVAIEGLIPDRRVTGKQSSDPPSIVNVFQPDWLIEAKAKAATEANLASRPDEKHPGNPSPKAPAHGAPGPDSLESLFAPPVNPWEKGPAASYASIFASAPESSAPFSMPRVPLGERR